jgi:hypothetical protein
MVVRDESWESFTGALQDRQPDVLPGRLEQIVYVGQQSRTASNRWETL